MQNMQKKPNSTNHTDLNDRLLNPKWILRNFLNKYETSTEKNLLHRQKILQEHITWIYQILAPLVASKGWVTLTMINDCRYVDFPHTFKSNNPEIMASLIEENQFYDLFNYAFDLRKLRTDDDEILPILNKLLSDQR